MPTLIEGGEGPRKQPINIEPLAEVWSVALTGKLMPLGGKPILRAGLIVVGASVLASLALLLTGNRVLVWEKKVELGETFVVEGHGDLGGNSQATLVCWYFTGRSVITNVFWYAPDNFLGRDSCPFLDRQD